MKNTVILATGLALALSMPVVAKDLMQSGSSRWVVADGAMTKDEAVAKAKEKLMALEANAHAMPSDVNVTLPVDYVKDTFKIKSAKFYVAEYYDMSSGPLYEVSAVFDYTYDIKEYN
ncbi:hypothetical protein ACPV5S_04615 [Vibrio astriarenae]